jgi:UDP-glucose 4-epimerase
MKILVAGGAGYIGSCCTEFLLDRGHEVVVYDSLVKGHRQAVDPRARFELGDLGDRERIHGVMRREHPQGVIHFAAFIEVGESMQDPGRYFRNNVACGLNLLDAAVDAGVTKLVFSSTAATYGMPRTIPIPESEPTEPINAYGESKLAFERIMAWYHRIHGLKFHALRYFNAAGASARFGEDHDPESHLIPLVLQVAEGRRDRIMIHGDDYETPDGTCVRDYIHVVDLAAAHLLALESGDSGCLNLGSGQGFSVRQIIDMAREVTGHPIPAEVGPRRPGDPPFLISDSTAARRSLGWEPRFDEVRAVIESAWRWRQQYPLGYGENP